MPSYSLRKIYPQDRVICARGSVALLRPFRAVLVPDPHISERITCMPSVQAQSPGTPLRQRPHRCPDPSTAPFHSSTGIHYELHSGERMAPSLAARHADWRTSVSARPALKDWCLS